jgi:hypothetical protein
MTKIRQIAELIVIIFVTIGCDGQHCWRVKRHRQLEPAKPGESEPPIHVLRLDRVHAALVGPILKKPPPRQLAQNADRRCKLRRMNFLLDTLAALSAKREANRFAIERHVRLQQGCRTSGSAHARVLLAAGTNGRARHELDDSGEREGTRWLVAGAGAD